jgi:phosphomannomutase
MVASGGFESGVGTSQPVSVGETYIERLLQGYEPGRPLTVAWDAGNGACGAVLDSLCGRLPGRHIVLNGAVDGTFPAHHPDPTVESNLCQLKEVVARERCDLGLAFDGDGDRIGAVDANGRVIWGDQLLVILASAVLTDQPGATIIAAVKSSQVFFDEIARMGGKPLMSRTGHSLIKNMMGETGALLAGEMSGHIFFAHRYFGFDDALYAAIRLLSVIGHQEGGLAALRDQMPNLLNTPELRIDCPDERKFAVIQEVEERLQADRDVQVLDIDGVRVTTPDGWWLLRASNTQPVLVGRCEARTSDGLQRLQDQLAYHLRKSGIEPNWTH